MGNDFSSQRSSMSQSKDNGETYEVFEKNVATVNRLLSKYVDPKNHCYASLKIDPKLSKIEFTPMWKSQVYVIVTKIPTLPDFWECALNSSGRPFYINHATRTTQWEAPWAIPYPPILKTPPMRMMFKLSYRQWTWAFNELSSSFDLPSIEDEDKSQKPDKKKVDEGDKKCPEEDPPEPLECVVCFVNKPTVVLPCAHAFCESCISQWKGRSDTCPVCRASLSKDDDDDWVLAENPSDEEIAKYMTEFLEMAKSK